MKTCTSIDTKNAKSQKTFSLNEIRKATGLYKQTPNVKGFNEHRFVRSDDGIFFGIAPDGYIFTPEGEWKNTRFVLAVDELTVKFCN